MGAATTHHTEHGRRLATRPWQPGHDQRYLASEGKLVAGLREALDPAVYAVEAQPILRCFTGPNGEPSSTFMRLDALVTHRATDNLLYLEGKTQGKNGNAEERVYKHHTMKFCRDAHARWGLPYHPFVAVFSGNLATDRRYTDKFPAFLDADSYLLWVDDDQALLERFITERATAWLD